MDLSLHHPSASAPTLIVKPIPRHPWPAVWYRTMWPAFATSHPAPVSQIQSSWSPAASLLEGHFNAGTGKRGFSFYRRKGDSENGNIENCTKNKDAAASMCQTETNSGGPAQSVKTSRLFLDITSSVSHFGHNITPAALNQSVSLDVATCDGPVHFERVSNPNFALTVQHCCGVPAAGDLEAGKQAILDESASKSKTYTCIYCQQSFKSLFCYQKHKKRHINPVSVDLTNSGSSTSTINLENSHGMRHSSRPQQSAIATAKYLNVQFFPCKICGCKFPSYYFVHKHIKLCH